MQGRKQQEGAQSEESQAGRNPVTCLAGMTQMSGGPGATLRSRVLKARGSLGSERQIRIFYKTVLILLRRIVFSSLTRYDAEEC